jgi:uncharacterized tellurite resistance protein B-like protein
MNLKEILSQYNDLKKEEIAALIKKETGIESDDLTNYKFISKKLKIKLNSTERFRLLMVYKATNEYGEDEEEEE